MADGNAWTGLLEETREALAHLRTDDLENLAQRAEAALEAAVIPLRCDDLRAVAAQHRVLSGLLEATEQNLNVLRRLRSRDDKARPRWAR